MRRHLLPLRKLSTATSYEATTSTRPAACQSVLGWKILRCDSQR